MKILKFHCPRGHECLVYDLGEDLWLCMMIIQRGWRVRYCALSDVFTQVHQSSLLTPLLPSALRSCLSS